MKRLMDLCERRDYTLMQGTLEQDISALVYDSRKVEPGCIFVCVVGAVSDGHSYLPDVTAKGASVVVVEHDVKVPADVTVLKVSNSRLALAELSAAWFGHPAEKLTTIGVTGTKGKTTTTYMMRQMMEHAGLKAGLIGTIEAIIGDKAIPANNTTPESYTIHQYFAQMVEAGCDSVVMEVSSDRKSVV